MDWKSCSVHVPDPNGPLVPTLSCVFNIVTNFIYWALVFSGSVAVILIVISGIRFISSDGDPKKIAQARKTFSFAIIGLLLIFLSFAILYFIAYFTGVGCLKPNTIFSANPFQTCGNSGAGGSAGGGRW